MRSLTRYRYARPEDDGGVLGGEAGVQLAPLVDIVFLLLVFFLVATTYLDEEKDVSIVLPRIGVHAGRDGGAPASARRLDRVLLNVREDGTVLLGNRPVSREALYRALVEARRRNPDVPVILRGDRAVPHGDVMSVYDVCRRARILNVAVAVEPAKPTADGRRPSHNRASPSATPDLP